MVRGGAISDEAGGAEEGVVSEPMGAKGFGLPSVPSGVSSILESVKTLKVGSEKIVSSSFMLLTLKSRERKSSESEELPGKTFGFPGKAGVGMEEIRGAGSGLFLMKKT